MTVVVIVLTLQCGFVDVRRMVSKDAQADLLYTLDRLFQVRTKYQKMGCVCASLEALNM